MAETHAKASNEELETTLELPPAPPDAEDVWHPLLAPTIIGLIVLVFLSFAAPTLLAFKLAIDPADNIHWVVRWGISVFRPDSIATGWLMAGWTAVPAFAAGLVMAYPSRRRLSVQLVGTFMALIAAVGTYNLLELKELLALDEVGSDLYWHFSQQLEISKSEFDHFLGLVKQSRDVAVAFFTAILGGGIGVALRSRR